MFCHMEKDRKTFELVNRYFEQPGSSSEGFTAFDNKIEKDEIQSWLEAQGDGASGEAVLAWIEENGKSFRDYLNTVKLVYLIWYCSHPGRPMNWENFCIIGDRLDACNGCLDSIY